MSRRERLERKCCVVLCPRTLSGLLWFGLVWFGLVWFGSSLATSKLAAHPPSFSHLLSSPHSYNKRSSSAKWDADELTLVEKRTYKSQMGFGGLTPGSSKKKA